MTRECGCHDCIAISKFPVNFQDPNGPLLNTVPPEVIKAVNKIVKQASEKGRILKAHWPATKIFCFSSVKQCFFEFQHGGWDLLVDMLLLHCSRSPSWIGVHSLRVRV